MKVSSMTSDSSDPVLLRGGIGSPCADEVSSGGNLGGGLQLKKGPWTTTEDAILLDYVTKHGEGNWNAVQKHSGLARCGKSCRLRWANHLRPDLRKGAFTPEEERRIVELHAKMGNKWARMSLELPGRTDNEIKNYWNTRIKRRQRAGLPIYPPDICLQAFNESKCENISVFSSGNAQHPDLLPIGGFEFPTVEFKGLDVNHQLYSFPTVDIPSCNLLDIPTRGMLAQGVNSSYSSKNLLSAFHPPKRFRRSESFLSSISPSFSSSFTDCNKIHRDGSVPNLQSFGFSSDYHQNQRPDLSASHGFHGIPSFSEPTWAMKLELPSLQIPTETRTGSWGRPSSPLPSLESLDTLIQSPTPEHTESGNLSPRNSGLLDAVLNESRCLRNVKSDPCDQKPNVSIVHDEGMDKISYDEHNVKSDLCDQKPNVSIVHEEGMDKISYDQHEAEWYLYQDPISPLCHSSASVFSIYTPVSGSSLDEAQSFETFPGNKLNAEGDLIPTELDRKHEMSNTNGLLFSRTDFPFPSDCLGLQTDHAKSLLVESCNWSTSW